MMRLTALRVNSRENPFQLKRAGGITSLRKTRLPETISFSYTDNKGKEKIITGQLAHKTYNGYPYVGFEPDYDKQVDVSAADKLEKVMKENGKGSTPEDEYYANMAKSLADFAAEVEAEKDESAFELGQSFL